MLVVSIALLLGASIALAGGFFKHADDGWWRHFSGGRLLCRGWLVGWYITSFVVKPNELVREKPYIEHNIEMTRQAWASTGSRSASFPRRPPSEPPIRRTTNPPCRIFVCGT